MAKYLGATTTTTVHCQEQVPPDDEPCGDEIEIEWEQHQLPPEKSGRKVCINCDYVSNGEGDHGECEDFEGDKGPHQWEDEYVDGDWETTIISAKTWCFHALTREKCYKYLEDLAVSQAEKRAEEGRI
jgi:hypothetical protein